MNDKRKYYWLWAAIGLLLCLNAGTIGWIVRKTRLSGANLGVIQPNAETFLPKRLNFSQQQRGQYRQYRQALRQAAKPQEDSLRQLRAELFTQLQKPMPPSDAVIDSLVNQMNAHTGQLTRLRFRQWQRISQLCTPAQRPAFNALMTRLMTRLNRTSQNQTRERRQRPL